MFQEILTISLDMPFRMGSVNCYLIKADNNFILVDTGSSNKRRELTKELEDAGCKPGNLKLIILTHGDFDHTGNVAYLREKFKTRIAMHADDWGMLEKGDMFWNRKSGGAFLGKIISIFSGFGKSEKCKPDLTLKEGDNLSEFGFEGQIVSIPGHSRGSIGVLAKCSVNSTGVQQCLLCGDLFTNIKKPEFSSIMDDKPVANASFEKLRYLKIDRVFPGHGESFLMEVLLSGN